MYEQRHFVIFDVSELPIIDFEQVLETSAETLRFSVDKQLVFVKWDGEIPPPCIESLTTKSMYYTYEEMLDILNGEEWTSSENMP
jgi:hypothetical protein